MIRAIISLSLTCYLLSISHSCLAFTWKNFWQTADQQGQRALTQGHPSQAAELFHTPEWKAIAYYRAGQYQDALEILSQLHTSSGYYNQGNTLAKLSQYTAAIDAYNQALKLDPSNQDAIFNRDVVKNLLQQQQQAQNQHNQTQSSQSKLQQHASAKKAQNGTKSSSDSAKSTQHAPTQPKTKTSHSSPSNQHSAAKPHTTTPATDTIHGKSAPHQPAASAYAKQQQQQEVEQWLRKIPDEPGGLLRQKFARDHLRYQSQSAKEP